MSGLKRYRIQAWSNFPILIRSGRSGVALFPAQKNDPVINSSSKNIKIDHFAFNLTLDIFEKARRKFKNLQISTQFQDHTYYHSLYIKDLEGHKVELTKLILDYY